MNISNSSNSYSSNHASSSSSTSSFNTNSGSTFNNYGGSWATCTSHPSCSGPAGNPTGYSIAYKKPKVKRNILGFKKNKWIMWYI